MNRGTRFAWLLRREWMQHGVGWLILGAVPLVLALVLLPFSDWDVKGRLPQVPGIALLAVSGYLYGVMLLAAMAVIFQAAGLARRDQQDRSIEFWLSLPTSHWQSVLATVAMHVLLMPLMVLALAFVGGQIVAVGAVVKLDGASAVGELVGLPWLGLSAVLLLRQIVGLVIAVLWLSPLLLLSMACAAWLKRWGVPAFAAGLSIGGLLVKQMSGSTVIWDAVSIWCREAAVALMPLTRGDSAIKAALEGNGDLAGYSDWMLRDLGQLLRDAGSLPFAAAILLAAAGFGLLVLRRARGA